MIESRVVCDRVVFIGVSQRWTEVTFEKLYLAHCEVGLERRATVFREARVFQECACIAVKGIGVD